jgi:membrane fusion protein, multidrug efflux system
MKNGDLTRNQDIKSWSRMAASLCYSLLLCLLEIGCQTAKPYADRPSDASKSSDATRTYSPPVTSPVHSPVRVTAIGEVIGFNTVVVKSRVDGPIVQVAFREGQNVKQGDLLAVIDPEMYRVALNEALASRDKDSTQLNQAKTTFARAKALFADGIIAQQEFDDKEASLHQLEAAVHADQATVDRASLELGFVKILAPIEGRVGFKTVDVGNIVHADDPGGIVTITQIRPIAIVFSVPPYRLNEILQSMKHGRVRVEAFSEDGKNLLGRGEVLSTDTAIDSTTGTAKIKALFSNTAQLLWPNEFVQINFELNDGESH